MYFINFYNGKQKRQRWGQPSRKKDAPTSNGACIYCGKIIAQNKIFEAIALGLKSKDSREFYIHKDCAIKKLAEICIEEIPKSPEHLARLIKEAYLQERAQRHAEAERKILNFLSSSSEESAA